MNKSEIYIICKVTYNTYDNLDIHTYINPVLQKWIIEELRSWKIHSATVTLDFLSHGLSLLGHDKCLVLGDNLPLAGPAAVHLLPEPHAGHVHHQVRVMQQGTESYYLFIYLSILLSLVVRRAIIYRKYCQNVF